MVLERFRLDGKTAIITGAGRGIGAAIALAYAEAGASLVLTSRTQEQIDAVAATARDQFSVPVRARAFDVNENENVEALVAFARDELGRIDIVVNNAGGTMPRPLLDTSPGFLERAFHFNVTTAFLLSKLAVPHMLEVGGGAIVNTSSLIGRLSDRGMLAYGTAKAALSHLTRLMAAELAPRIRVNAIAVGSVATSALEVVLEDDALRSTMIEGTPMKRLGEPEDIALAALYLASPAASYVTGKVFEIDGGLEAPNLALGLPDL